MYLNNLLFKFFLYKISKTSRMSSLSEKDKWAEDHLVSIKEMKKYNFGRGES